MAKQGAVLEFGREAEPDAPARARPLALLPCVEAKAHGDLLATLRSFPDFRILPPALPATLRSRAQTDRPDVIVFATEDPGRITVGRESAFRELFLTVPTLLLVRNPKAACRQAARLHIASVLPMDISEVQLSAAVRAVAAGLSVSVQGRTDDLSEARILEADARFEPEHLTAREIEVLRLMALGRANKQVAIQLHMSEHTAKFHVRTIMGKLGAASRTEAVTLGILHGLIAI